MNVPSNLKYSNDHEWCRMEGDTAYVGITDFAQSQLGDIVFVDVPTEGETVASVAQSYALREKSLRKLNRLKAGAALRTGQTLRIR